MTPTTNRRIEVLPHILAALESNRRQLDEMRQQSNVNGIAWVSRNILELVVWAKYCGQSDENAQEFIKDAARDSMSAMNLPDEMVKPEKREAFRTTRETMLASAAEDHIEKPMSYQRVPDVAKQIGIDLFGKYNMVLSKWAHPTAMSIFGANRGHIVAVLADFFYELGKNLGDGAIMEIRGFLGL